MDPQPLNIKVDSKQAQADLAALARALDTAGNAATNFKQKFTSGISGADQAVKSATAAMGRFAQVAALVSKIKISDDPAKQVKMLASALAQLGKMDAQIKASVASLGRFAQVAALVDRIRINPTNIKNLTDFANAVALVAKTRSPSSNSLKGLVDFIEVAARAQALKFNPAMAANLRAFSAAMDSIGRARIITPARVNSLKELFNVLSSMKAPSGGQKLQALFATLAAIRVPTDKAISRLEKLFNVLASAKAIPGAAKIAHDLDLIASSAMRAASAINALPGNFRGLNSVFRAAGSGAAGLNQQLSQTPGHAGKANSSFGQMGRSLGDLSGRFNLAYQSSTLFSQFFAAFTLGSFLRGIYDANIQLAKLQKALVFSTGTFAGAERAVDAYIGIANDLGLSLKHTTDAYSKFTLSARSSGMGLQQSNDTYKAIGTALQVVGASSQQTELAFYGLTQMIQKGKVSAEEFNRQIGEQIPGNAVLGARAMSELEGRTVSVAEFFEKMGQGQIMSAQFVPAYARQVQRQFEPLIALAKERPDAALNRLTNAFFVFSRAVGNNGMMKALTTEFDRLTNKIMYTDEAGVHLTPQFQKLADSIGRGLTSAIHILGDSMVWLTDHLDEVMATLKALLAIRVGATFLDWTKGALAFGASLGTIIAGGNAAAAAGAGVGAATAGGAVAGTAAAGAAAAAAAAGAAAAAAAAPGGPGPIIMAPGQATRGIIAARARGINTTTRNQGFGSRLSNSFAAISAANAPRVTDGDYLSNARANARVGANSSGGLLSSLGGFIGFGGGKSAGNIAKTEGAAAKAVGALGKLGGVLGKVLPLLGFGLVGGLAAAGIALAAFGDNTTKVGGKTVKFNDIVMGGFNILTKGVGEWWEKSKGNFKFFTDALDGLGKNSGEITATIVASFVTLGKVLGRVLETIGTIFSEFIHHSPLATFAKLMAAIVTGDFKGAQSILKESFDSGFGFGNIAKSVGGMITGSMQDIGDFGKTRQAVIDEAANIAAQRDQAVAADAAAEATKRLTEATLAQQTAADEAAARLGEIEAINRRIALGNIGTPTSADILKRAQSAYDAPSAKPISALTASVGAVTADVKKGASAEVQAAIDAAATKYGVSAEYLYRTAKRESNFNTNAKAGTSSAGGLFQFIDSTAAQFGLAGRDRYDPMKAADAAARLTQRNAQFLEKQTGHAATNGELYAAHFLGAGGAAKLINTAAKSPMTTGAELFPAAAKANRYIFYTKDGRAKSTAEIMDSINATYGAAANGAGVGGGGLGGASPEQVESLTKKYNNAAETYNGLISRNASPATAAQAAYDKYLHDISELQDLQDKLKEQGIDSFIDPAKLADAMQQAEKELQQAINPFMKMNEEVTKNNEILALRAQGLSDQADYQQQLNDYVLDGYKATELDTEANRKAFKAGQDRNAQLQAQIALTGTLNDLQRNRIARSGSAFDVALSNQIRPQDGETYDQAVARMKSQGTYGIAVQAARAEESQRTDFAKDDLRISLAEMQSSARLSASARAYRDDFKNYLQELSGISTGTLDEIVAKADPALVALARHAADVRMAIENAPGFQRWADQLEPLSKRLNDLKGDFAEGISDNLAAALNGDKVDWASFFHDFRRQVIKAQVQDVMKGAIGWLTGGKTPDALMTPEDKTKAAADATSYAASQTSQAATGLGTAATSLNSAAMSLTAAAQTIAGAASSNALVGGAGADVLSGGFTSAAALQAADAARFSTALPNIPSIAANDNANPDVVTIMGKRPAFTPAPVLGAFPDRAIDTSLPNVPSIIPSQGGAAGGGIFSKIGDFISKPQSGLAGLAKSAGIVGLLGLLGKKKKAPKEVTPYDIPGVIGESRAVTMSGTEVAAHSNPIADILNFGLSMAGSAGFGAPGGNLTSVLGLGKGAAAGSAAMKAASAAGTNNLGGWLKRAFGGMTMGGFFEEGGYATAPVSQAAFPTGMWANAPHYKEGTPNTSGIAAVLHPNEAVIPLSGNRKVPVEGDFGGATNHYNTTNMTIVTPDANSFRKSRGSIERDQGRAQRRANLRNLSA